MWPVTVPGVAPPRTLRGMADADPAQHRLAEAREVDDALDDERLDLRDDAAGGQDKRVESEAGVEPGTEDRDPAAAGERVEPVRGRRVVRPGIGGLLGGRDHVRPRLDSVAHVVCDGREERRGRDHDDVGPPRSASSRSARPNGPSTSTSLRRRKISEAWVLTWPAP